MRLKINCAELHHCIASEALSRIGVQNGVESGLVLGKGFSVPAAFPPPPTKNFLHTPPPPWGILLIPAWQVLMGHTEPHVRLFLNTSCSKKVVMGGT